MVRIKLGLFEGVACCTILPTIGFSFTILFLIISIIIPQKNVVYMSLMVSFIVCAALLAFSLVVCQLICLKSKNELMVNSNAKSFKIHKKTYRFSDIKSCKYFICKWYAIPFLLLYKQGQGGLVEIKLAEGETIHFKILYKDYLRLKCILPNIVEI